MRRCLAFVLVGAVQVVACSSSDAPSPRPEPSPLAPVTDATTVVDASLSPSHPRQSYQAGPNPAAPDALASYLERGFGELTAAPGVPYVARTIDGSPVPPAGPAARRLLRFVHLADLQITDDESPTRVGMLDAADVTAAALRPQDAYLCRMANAAVRTINAHHARDPIAFTLLGGDNADSAQDNELDWVLGVLGGRPSVECDSGADDDPIPGPDNDGKDAFVAEGLAMPWRWVTGNHDVLVQGNVAPNESNSATAVGDYAYTGTRDYGRGGALTTEEIVPDARRAVLSRAAVMAKVAGDADGHGLGASERASGRATYTFDVEGTPLRFLVVDTAHDSGGSEGVITRADLANVIEPLLERAAADAKWVILASHHAAKNLSEDGGGLGQTVDAVTTDEWVAALGRHPHVLFSMVAHSHVHRVTALTPPGGHAFWEVMTASIADYPHQLRIVEIFDQDDGWIMLRSAPVDLAVGADPVAAEGRRRGVVDWVSGWNPDEGPALDDRSVELWIKKPEAP